MTSSWTTKYSDDRALLILDLSLVFNCGCPLPNGVIDQHLRHLSNSPDYFKFYKSLSVLAELNARTESAVKLSHWLRKRRDKTPTSTRSLGTMKKKVRTSNNDAGQLLGIYFNVPSENGN